MVCTLQCKSWRRNYFFGFTPPPIKTHFAVKKTINVSSPYKRATVILSHRTPDWLTDWLEPHANVYFDRSLIREHLTYGASCRTSLFSAQKWLLVCDFKEVASLISHPIHHIRLSNDNKWNEMKDWVLIDGNCLDLSGCRTNFVISVFALALKFPTAQLRNGSY